MRLYCVFIACLALFGLFSQAHSDFSQDPDKCCFSFSNMRIPVKQVESYHTTHLECRVNGVVFVTKTGKEICADPTERWVQRLRNLLDARNLWINGTIKQHIDGSFTHSKEMCCFSFTNRPIPKSQVTGYYETDQVCPKNGIIFTTVRHKEICADPEERWVEILRMNLCKPKPEMPVPITEVYNVPKTQTEITPPPQTSEDTSHVYNEESQLWSAQFCIVPGRQ